MRRTEVVIDNQVFDLGLKRLAERVSNRDGKLPTLELEVCGTIFQVGYVTEDKAIALNWWGFTTMRNIVWTRFVFLRLRWPFIKNISAFTYATKEI